MAKYNFIIITSQVNLLLKTILSPFRASLVGYFLPSACFKPRAAVMIPKSHGDNHFLTYCRFESQHRILDDYFSH